MRWLAKRWLRGDVLELGEGRCLYYPVFATGPGFVLAAAKRRAFEGFVALEILTPVVLFAAPKRFLAAWLGEFFGPFYSELHIGWGLWFLVLGPLFWLLVPRYKRLVLESCDRCDPANWDEDLGKLASVEGIGWKELAIYLFVSMFLGVFLGHVLDEVLMLLIAP